MKQFSLILFLLLPIVLLQGQQDSSRMQWTVFYHENGQVSSEGMMRDGRPDGYWKTYNEEGTLISEGNRKDFLLDSIWTFYSDSGQVVMTITYEKGVKNGPRVIYRKNEKVVEPFVQDVKEGLAYHFEGDRLVMTVPFRDGLENGLAKEYDPDGRIITLTEYRKGYIVRRENINRLDRNGLKQGLWKFFFESGELQMEGPYLNDLRNGYFKEYDKEGNLKAVSKYVQGVKQEDAREVSRLEVKVDYFPSGQKKIVGQYFNGIPEGVRREYDEEGKLVRGYLFNQGIIVGRGITSEQGLREGPWTEYYDDGKLYAEGVYRGGKRVGKWKFYFRSGKLEQEGNFDNQGRYDGPWRWYYESGTLLREEEYEGGRKEGLMTEYSEDGKVIIQGEYLDDLEEGVWKYDMGDHVQEGPYVDGMRQGEWKYYYRNGNTSYSGRFVEDNPNGKHTWYWENGRKKDEGYYVMGRRQGEWVKYDINGVPFLIITYDNGIEKRYDGTRLEPVLEDEQPVED